MSVAGAESDEQRKQSRTGMFRRRATLPGGRRLPLAAALLGLLLAGVALALRGRTSARTASHLSPSVPAPPSPTHSAASSAQPACTESGVVAAPTVSAATGPRHIEASGPARTGRSRRRPAQRAALAASLLTLCAAASVMVSGIAPQGFAIVSASSVEDILPPPVATIVEEPPGPDCAVLQCVVLTFDDGPDPHSTPALLDILESRGVTANFFVLGSLVQGNEDIILRMHRLGMGVENHTWDHPNLAAMSPAAVTDQLARTNSEINRVLGYTPKYMRPPYGAWTPGVTPTHGMHPVLWEVDPQDWLYRNSATVTQNVVDLAGPGDVILLHDIHQTSVDAVPMIIDSLHERGYTFATLDDLYATRPGCHVDQYCTAPVPYANTPSATTTVAPAVVSPSPALPDA